MKRLRSQRGVAMVTVMLVGAALTAVTSMAAFSTIRELRAGTDDRKAAEALSYAEAGIDRFLQYLRIGNVTWAKLIRAGCEDAGGLVIPTGKIGNGNFTATLKVYEPNPTSGNPADQFVPGACNYRASAPNDPQGQYFVITSKGTHPNAKRVVQQVVKVGPRLPVGILANSVEANGTPNMTGISLFSETQIRGREKITFTGLDPYYFIRDVFPDGVVGRDPGEHVPAAAHAPLGIFMKQNGTKPEFPGPDASDPEKNCDANGVLGAGQSLWDSDGSTASGTVNSGCVGQVGYPITSKFSTSTLDAVRPHRVDEQDHQMLRDAAKANGIYCAITSTGSSCTLLGNPVAYQSTWQTAHIQPLFDAGVKNFVAYFDFTSGDTLTNQVKWQAPVWPCNAVTPDLSKSAVIVVRRGGLEVQSAQINGAVIIDGEFKYSGNPTINGTIISQSGFRITGNATFSMDPCWVQNMPGVFLATAPHRWAEIDR